MRRDGYRRLGPLAVAIMLVSLAWPTSSMAAGTFRVDAFNDAPDSSPGNGVCRASGGGCTLRAAVQEANELIGAQTIIVPAGNYELTIPGTGYAEVGDLDINESLTIDGRGATVRWSSSLPLSDRHRIFDIFDRGSGMTVTIDDLTVRGGRVRNDEGPGIRIKETSGVTVTLKRLRLVDNIVRGTSSYAVGGGLFVGAGTEVTMVDSTVSNNEADRGSGVFVAGTGSFWVHRSTFDHNSGRTSAFETWGTVRLLNSTISDNASSGGRGGLDVAEGAATIDHSTIASNEGYDLSQTAGAVTIISSIVGGTCSLTGGAFTPSSGDAESGTSCGFVGGTNLQDADLRLGALANYGGLTETRALGAGSDAMGLATASFFLSCLDPDQRGAPRGGAPCDSGSYQRVECAGVAVTVIGTMGRDVLKGTGGRDSFLLLDGNDVAKGRGGSDRLCGGSGDDTLNGGPGIDSCVGGPGTDTAEACETELSIP